MLELATYSGYGALAMAGGLAPGGRVTTVEQDPERAAWARQRIAASPRAELVEVVEGPALEIIGQLDPGWDLAFIDADKESYPAYHDALLPRLAPRGLLVLDNTLLSGRVLAPADDTGARVMAELNDRIAADPDVVAVLVPLRDGSRSCAGPSTSERREDLVVVRFRMGTRQDVGDLLIGVDHERRARDAPVGAAVHVLLHPGAVGLGDAVVGVGEQGEVQAVLGGEGGQDLRRVGGDAEDPGVPRGVVLRAVADVAGLLGAARRAGTRVEVQDRPAIATIGERDGGAVLVGEGEVGGGVSGSEHARHRSRRHAAYLSRRESRRSFSSFLPVWSRGQ